jgi:site-specific DNA-methyltransferase (adenine-specific)
VQQLNRLYYGDNLDVLRQNIAAESVDLIYLDPPFAASRLYGTPFAEGSRDNPPTQIEGFEDTWIWAQDIESVYGNLISGDEAVALIAILKAIRREVGTGDLLAYLTMMAPRLIEFHRALRRTGSIFLHCDPAVSHYLKVMTDAIFGNKNFKNEIIWKRTQAKIPMKNRLSSEYDVILAYAKSDEANWNDQALFKSHDARDVDPETAARYSHRDPDGRRYQLGDLTSPNPDRPSLTYEFLGVTRVWRFTKKRMEQLYDAGKITQSAPGQVPRVKRYLDEQRGRPLGDVWADIPSLNSQAAERLGYQAQEPVELLTRIIEIASPPGGLVLDPFAGSGTTIDAAQRLGRRWIGIDITLLAVDLTDVRLRRNYSESIKQTYEILGIPLDLPSAESLWRHAPFEFKSWCVALVGGQPNDKPRDSQAIDGIIRIPVDTKGKSHRVLVSVKGEQAYPSQVRDLMNIVESQHAAMGLLISLQPPTAAMKDAALSSGIYNYPLDGQQYPRIQIVTVGDLLESIRPDLPTPLLPYIQTRPRYNNDASQQYPI